MSDGGGAGAQRDAKCGGASHDNQIRRLVPGEAGGRCGCWPVTAPGPGRLLGIIYKN